MFIISPNCKQKKYKIVNLKFYPTSTKALIWSIPTSQLHPRMCYPKTRPQTTTNKLNWLASTQVTITGNKFRTRVRAIFHYLISNIHHSKSRPNSTSICNTSSPGRWTKSSRTMMVRRPSKNSQTNSLISPGARQGKMDVSSNRPKNRRTRVSTPFLMRIMRDLYLSHFCFVFILRLLIAT